MQRQQQSSELRVEEQRNESLAQLPGLIYATIVGATGAFTAPGAAPAPAQNPVCNYQGVTITPARTGAGVYTLTITNTASGVAQNLPTSEYKISGACIGGAANANFNFSVAANVITVLTAVAAVATDENFWIQIEPITG